MNKKLLASAVALSALAMASTAQAQMDSGQYCREYQQSVTIQGKTQEGYGTACLQPDGSWQMIPSAQQAAVEEPDPQPNIAYAVRDNSVYMMPPEPFVYFEFDGGRHYYPREYPRRYQHRHWH